MSDAILTLNAGSSSLKFSVYATEAPPALLMVGQVENLGPSARLKVGDEVREIGAADHTVAIRAILETASAVLAGRSVIAVGHRIVHGGEDYTGPVLLTAEVREKLAALSPLAPLHQPHNLAAVEAALTAFPDAPQIGCFDTAFHRGHDWAADTFALPRRFYEEGVRRYGFHGLSYDYITGVLRREEPEIAAGRVVIAHLGNGASMCAVKGGRSVASTMGFSALDGLAMGTRCGQLDPGVLLYLMERGMSAAEITTLLYKESGLKGLSGISHDMRTLEASDAPEAAQAIDYYTFRIRRELGALTAVLGGLDALVFCGGIGENSSTIRARVCEGMEWLGITLDPVANGANARRISSGPVAVMAIPTDEERVIAEAAVAHLA
ncbi:acetate/propionate family kinase [Pontivivens ytuae]|uniref:Acetate kinase n=1 Tax=Pontivivens ytuae TaxID=2789856 RepID=A0A7S9LUE3_9RHOB|nr:acetate/propionate family kinase [Pontivivens ytuae]QPH55501.1 acetate/propionate family kinase [Pontivivens ytuae]